MALLTGAAGSALAGDGDGGLTRPEIDGLALGVADPRNQARQAETVRRDPLVLDLDGDGLELVGVNQSTAFFDMKGDGFRRLTGWVKGDDGLLALDRDGNGRIDGISELFGDERTSGLHALAQYDDNRDGRIDSRDAIFAKLRVWRDLDQDGVSDAGEMASLAEHGIASLALNGKASNATLNGSRIAEVASFTRADGTTRTMADVLFQNDEALTRYRGDAKLSLWSLVLPTLRGYGRLKDVSLTLATDDGLRDQLVELLVDGADGTDAAFLAGLNTRVDDILFRWAGVDGVGPASRGANIDARIVAFLEAYLGTPYRQEGNPNPNAEGASQLRQAFATIHDRALGNLMAQGSLSAVLKGVTYNARTDRLEGTLSLDRAGLGALADSVRLLSTDERGLAWLNLARIVRRLETGSGSSGVATAIAGFLRERGDTITAEGFGKTRFAVGRATDDQLSISGSGAGWLFGGAGNDRLGGNSGNDRLDGGAGNDSLYGEDGDDILTGGAGDDILDGGAGNDRYVFNRGDGRDRIRVWDWERRETETIELGAGIGPRDVSCQSQDGHLILNLGAGDQITVESHFADERWQIETLRFADGTTWDLAAIARFTGTEGNDRLTGSRKDDTLQGLGGDDSLSAGAGNDRVDGGAGNDQLRGERGIDVLDGGAGNDRLWGGDDNDRLEGGAGNDILDGEYGDDILTGGAGDDILDGGAGNDRYVFNRGDGRDRIRVWDWERRETETIELGAGIGPRDVSYQSQDGHLILNLGGGDQITVESHFTDERWQIETLRFADGTTWDLAALARFTGTEGNDRLTGSRKDDTLQGLGGDDSLSAGDGNDRVAGGAGNDQLWGERGADVLGGGAGDDRLWGGDDNDWLGGGIGNDSLYGEYGDDILTGGVGDDILDGGAGNDRYVFNRGGGRDRIRVWDWERRETETIELGAGIGPRDVSYQSQDGHLILNLGAGDQITVESHFTDERWQIETLRFADGTTWDLTALAHFTGTEGNDRLAGSRKDDTLQGLGGDDSLSAGDGNDRVAGGVGNDQLWGERGDDMLDGGAGNDRLSGGAGSDTYSFGRGDGQERIADESAAGGEVDVLSFKAGIAANQLWFRRAGNDLEIRVLGGNDKVDIERWFAGTDNRLQRIQVADGKTLQEASVNNLINAMASFAPPASGQTTLPAAYQAQLEPVIAANWH